MTNYIYAPDVEPTDYVSAGPDGVLHVAKYGDLVIGQVYKSLILEKSNRLFLNKCATYKMEGYWKWKSDIDSWQFYKDKYTPTGKFKRENWYPIKSNITVKEFIDQLKQYNDDKYIVKFDEDDIYVTWIEEWDE